MRQLHKKEVKDLNKSHGKRSHTIYLFLENIQYARNVASIFRTADAAGVKRIMLAGISQQPPFGKELRQVSRSKEKSVTWEYVESTKRSIERLKQDGFKVIAVEVTDAAQPISKLPSLIADADKVCFVVGSEVYGVTNELLGMCDFAVYIPMYGKGASLNVSSSAAVVLYSFD